MVSVSSVNNLISAVGNNVKKPNIFKRLYNSVPNVDIASDRYLTHVENFGKKCTSAHQRGILGATALLTQPFIDAHNKDVDDKTKKYSVARTIAKIIAGTLTGVAIRYGCIQAMKMKGFQPKRWDRLSEDVQNQYRNAMGTIVSLVVMLVTNFAIDAPLTKFLTNVLTHNMKGDKNENS